MVKRFGIMVCVSALVSCQPRLPDLITGLTIGNFDTTAVIRIAYTPVFELEPQHSQTTSIELDLDQDQVQDLEIRYTFDYEDLSSGDMQWDISATSQISVAILESNFRLSQEMLRDTVYFCKDETGPDYRDWEYTANTGWTCDGTEQSGGVKEILESVFCQFFGEGGGINAGLDWNFGELVLASHTYYRQGDNDFNVTYDNRKDLRLGLSDWAAETCLGVCKVDTPRNKYGYIRFQLVQLDEASWKLQVLETILQK